MGFIPQFLLNKFNKGFYSGEDKGFLLFFDITNFTSISEKFKEYGKQGTESLFKFLESLFDPIIQVIYRYGGYITGYSGDSLLSVFPDDSGEGALSDFFESASIIKKIVKENKNYETPWGNLKIKARIGLNYGSFLWGIGGKKEHKTFYFMGDSLISTINVNQDRNKTKILVCPKIYELYGKYYSRGSFSIAKNEIKSERNIIKNEYELIENKTIDGKNPKKAKRTINKQLPGNQEKYQSLFYPDFPERIELWKGEIRNVLPVFIGFRKFDDPCVFRNLINDVITESDIYKGFLKGIEFSEKGAMFVLFFGAPKTHEDNLQRGLRFIRKIMNLYGDLIKAGASYGTVFAGFIGNEYRYTYDIIGDTVNTAARLMESANFGEALFDGKTTKYFIPGVSFVSQGMFSLKGKRNKIKVYKLSQKIEGERDNFYNTKMVGRDLELRKILKTVDLLRNNTCGGCIYIYGEPGSGKSRLAYEIHKKIPDDMQSFFLLTDSILMKSLNPFIYFLRQYFGYSESADRKDNFNSFQNRYGILATQLANLEDKKNKRLLEEMKEYEPYLLTLLGIQIGEHSILENIDPREKHLNTLYAIKTVVKSVSLLKPLILLIEDIQWFDPDSMEMMFILARNVNDFPFLVIASSRYGIHGEKYSFNINNFLFDEQEIDLKMLNENDVFDYVQEKLGSRPDKNLIEFIKSKTSNNPFYIDQFCNYLTENSLLEFNDKGSFLKKKIEGIPDRINDVLISRIDNLSKDLRETIQIAAILGREFNILILEEMMKYLDNTGKEDGLKDGEEKFNPFVLILEEGIQYKIWARLSELKYIFQHFLLCEAIYSMQMSVKLKKMHLIAAKSIESIYGDDSQYYHDLAYHYEKGGDLKRSDFYWEKAYDRFLNNYENSKAMEALDHLIEHCQEDKRVVSLKCLRLDLELNTGQFSMIEEEITWLLARVEQMGDYTLINQVRQRYSAYLAHLADTKRELENLKILEDICINHLNSKGLGYLYRSFGGFFWLINQFEKALEYLNKALEYLDPVKDVDEYARCFNVIGINYAQMGDIQKSIEFYKKSLEVAKNGHMRGVARATINLCIAYYRLYDYKNALLYNEIAREQFLQMGAKTVLGHCYSYEGSIYIRVGQFLPSAEACLRNMELISEIGIDNERGRVYINIGSILGNIEKKNGSLSSSDYSEIIRIMGKIQQLTHMELTPENYFKKAIEISQKFNYGETLIPAYYEFADYLYSKDRFYAVDLLKRAWDESQKIGMGGFSREVFDIAKKIGVSKTFIIKE